MTDDFEAEIKRLAQKFGKGVAKQTKQGATVRESDVDFKAVIREFQKAARKGADIFNDSVNEESLVVYELPAEFLEIFLGISGRRGGLAIAAPQRLAVFFDEDPNLITVIGKLRSNDSGVHTNVNKSLQLIKISFSSSDNGYVFKDNTGKPLDSEGIISVIIGWLVKA